MMDPSSEMAAPAAGPAHDPQSEESPLADGRDNPPSKKQQIRKRTKTGCLTCRRRRIKCDEGKPTCNNCIKSKRMCDGYNQRVIFKEPMGTYQGVQYGSSIIYQAEPSAILNAQLSAAQAKASSSQGPLPAIAPKPSVIDYAGSHFLQNEAFMGQNRSASFGPLDLNGGAYGRPNPAAYNTRPFMPERPPAGDLTRFQGREAFPMRGGYVPPAAPVFNNNLDARRASSSSFIEESRPRQPLQYEPREPPTWANGGVSSMDHDALYWDSDDDASMAESDDEFSVKDDEGHVESDNPGALVARRLRNPLDVLGMRPRTFSTFADDSVLSTYFPSSTNSPLNDTQTAAIFWYFVNVTAPSMSLYERHPLDPTPIFQGQPVPKARRHIWTYTFPVISLNHPALLQAILALGSLQMAKLQGVPATASMKHYHLSLRRIAKNYQSPVRRVQPATLAATLLLGFYEVWNSDHDKWCKHMWGARAILKEIPIREMTRAVLDLRRQKRQAVRELRSPGLKFGSTFPYVEESRDEDVGEVDTAILAKLTGGPVAYEDEFYDGHTGGSSTWVPPESYTEKDIETYENMSDLFWWYCKMDVYQSILGGTPLLMDYSLWTQCAPRSPIGRIDAIYGTYDHLMLLLGRLANFAARDLSRKRKAKKMEGPGGSPPGFPGMMPSKGHVTVPTGFSPPREASPQSEGPEEADLEARTAAALREWESIREAFQVFQDHLGPDFEPMGPEYVQPLPSPFGPALRYRTYSIAGMWTNFYMGMIVLYRAHPTMPPVAMVAAGMAAEQTAPYAIQIGRVVAGVVVEDYANQPNVSTVVGAVFIESCFPLFVSGVQYQDTAQRHWTIKRLHDVARYTGWQSARQIAGGCESAWVKAASMGRGPPYEPPPDYVDEVPQSVWSRPRRIDERIRELDDDDGKIVLSSSERPQYALGLLSMEGDFEKLVLREENE